MYIINVALPIPLNQTFEYFIKDNNNPPIIGVRVLVNFKNKNMIGIITSISSKSKFSINKIKSIIYVIDNKSLFSNSLWNLLKWSNNYYHYPIGKILFQALPVLIRKGYPIKIIFYLKKHLIKNNIIKLSDILNKLFKKNNYLNFLKLNIYTVKNYIYKYLHNIQINFDWYINLKINNQDINLNIEQNNAVNAILKKKNSFCSFLLYGITGSGKTEVYLKVLENILAQGKQVLVLVPEISLTPQTIKIFQKRFNVPIKILHSSINDNEKFSIWLNSLNREIAIIIGTRSAIFTPFYKLGIIIIDEEHDISYKQQKKWKYNARDLAVFRAKEENIPIVLGTATPSLETLYNVKKKKYKQINIKKKPEFSKPVIHQILNIKGISLKYGFSSILLKKIKKNLQNGNQVMLFLNRRGFAPILLCHECVWIAKCYDCDRYYTIHKNINKLICHHCKNKQILIEQCPKCGSTQLIAIGLGTEQIENVLPLLFPNIPITRIDSDTITRKGILEKIIKQINKGGARILIGTQILSKGHNFKDITLVSLLNIDNILFSNDFRSTERFAQLYTQVSGRTGRGKKKGYVFLQTHYPDNPILKILLKKDYIEFANQLLEERLNAGLPPFTKQILFKANDVNNQKVYNFLKNIKNIIYNNLFKDKKLFIIGPNPAILSKCHGKYRWELLLSHISSCKLQYIIRTILPLIKKNTNLVKWSIDVDPINS